MIFQLAKSYMLDIKNRWIIASSWICILSTALGIATLITVLSVMHGFATQLTHKLLDVQSHIYIAHPHNGPIPLLVHKRIAKVEQVLERHILLTQGDYMQPVLVNGKANIEGIIVGKELATCIDVTHEVQLLNMTTDNEFNAPTGKMFAITEVRDFGLTQTNRGYVLCNNKQLADLCDLEYDFTHILIYLTDLKYTQEVIDFLAKTYPRSNITSWQEHNGSFLQVLQTQRFMMFIIVSLIVLISSFNGVSAIMMLIQEKAKEIAILYLFGVSRMKILLTFMLIALYLNSIGVILGVILGVLLSVHIDNIRLILERYMHVDLFPSQFYNLDKLPYELDPYAISYIIFGALCLCLLACLYPCIQATRVNLANRLRY